MARVWHSEHMKGRSFDEELAAYLCGGIVFASDDAFIMARPVRVFKGEVAAGEKQKANAWYVALASGSKPFEQFLRVMPYELPLLAWCRGDGELKVYPLDKFREKIYGQR